VAVAEAARDQLELERIDLAVAADPLGKPHLSGSATERVERVRRSLGDRPGLRAVAATSQLVVELSGGYDVVVLGADKWDQVLDPGWYDDVGHRDRAVAALPLVAVAPRHGCEVRSWPGVDLRVLDLPAHLGRVSATAVRDGRTDWAV